ncbi:putative membrane protein [Stackebrandtia albiflava]|uniref:Putative membrane protein n=1 Tax=Stackebrandtia albiflava TaxID=406432 RepID=A0A562V9F2_9ACTN|nr:DUF1622 domain-containing protein [Stackebrandtia albiflava]TWJ14514.1 putative membrane protein [Stackebrandtia albiflava]
MYEETVTAVGAAIDLAGVAVIVVGMIVATVRFAWRGGDGMTDRYRRYRQGIGRAILLGLEFLVAGDIIRTVAITPTFQGVGVLALIVAVRTFLSFSLEVELEGRLPWRPDRAITSRPRDTR